MLGTHGRGRFDAAPWESPAARIDVMRIAMLPFALPVADVLPGGSLRCRRCEALVLGRLLRTDGRRRDDQEQCQEVERGSAHGFPSEVISRGLEARAAEEAPAPRSR